MAPGLETLSAETAEILDRIGSLLELHTRSASISLHHFDPNALAAMMVRGELVELKREQLTGFDGDSHYLVGKFEVNGVDVTLFSSSLEGEENQ